MERASRGIGWYSWKVVALSEAVLRAVLNSSTPTLVSYFRGSSQNPRCKDCHTCPSMIGGEKPRREVNGGSQARCWRSTNNLCER
jgi:hypothetical protein